MWLMTKSFPGELPIDNRSIKSTRSATVCAKTTLEEASLRICCLHAGPEREAALIGTRPSEMLASMKVTSIPPEGPSELDAYREAFRLIWAAISFRKLSVSEAEAVGSAGTASLPPAISGRPLLNRSGCEKL